MKILEKNAQISDETNGIPITYKMMQKKREIITKNKLQGGPK
jgi:hypothetical protein